MNLARFFLSTVALLAVPALAAAGCNGDDEDAGVSNEAGAVDRARLDGPFRPDASCPVVIESPELAPGTHEPEGAALTWSSNPPASGPHYGVWPAYAEYTQPVPRGYLVHAMEHGAIVLLYKCDAACPAIVDGLRKVRDALPNDPLCSPDVRVRVVISPDPLLDAPVAAVAWGWTYKAQCVDTPTLEQFAREHYGHGPEATCANGRPF